MKTLEIEIFGEEANAVVARHPGRSFPGVLVQGDTLHIMAGLAHYVRMHLETSDEELRGASDELAEGLGGLVALTNAPWRPRGVSYRT